MQEKNLINTICNHYNNATNILKNVPQSIAGDVRAALEAGVRLFWLKKLGKEDPVWIIRGREEFNLLEAIKDTRFSSHFKAMTLYDMDAIRKTCNEVLHPQRDIPAKILDHEEAEDLYDRLKKCIRAIEKVLNLNIVQVPTFSAVNNIKEQEKELKNAVLSPQTEKPSTNDLIYQKVVHILYGEGIITSLEGKLVRVDFNGTIKNLSFPESFKTGFVKFVDVNLQEGFNKKTIESNNKPKDTVQNIQNINKTAKLLVLSYMQKSIECSRYNSGLMQSEIFKACGFSWGEQENATVSNQQYWIVALLKNLEEENLVQQDVNKCWRLNELGENYKIKELSISYKKCGEIIRANAKRVVIEYMKNNSRCSKYSTGLRQAELFRLCGFDWGDYEKAESSRQQYWIVGLLRTLEIEGTVQRDPVNKKWRLA